MIDNVSTFSYDRGAALLVEAANMGDPDAQYELGCHLRREVRFFIPHLDGNKFSDAFIRY